MPHLGLDKEAILLRYDMWHFATELLKMHFSSIVGMILQIPENRFLIQARGVWNHWRARLRLFFYPWHFTRLNTMEWLSKYYRLFARVTEIFLIELYLRQLFRKSHNTVEWFNKASDTKNVHHLRTVAKRAECHRIL